MLASKFTQSAEIVFVRASCVCTFHLRLYSAFTLHVAWGQASTHYNVVVKASCTYLAHHELESVLWYLLLSLLLLSLLLISILIILKHATCCRHLPAWMKTTFPLWQPALDPHQGPLQTALPWQIARPLKPQLWLNQMTQKVPKLPRNPGLSRRCPQSGAVLRAVPIRPLALRRRAAALAGSAKVTVCPVSRRLRQPTASYSPAQPASNPGTRVQARFLGSRQVCPFVFGIIFALTSFWPDKLLICLTVG